MYKNSAPDYFLAAVCLLLLMSGIIILASVSAVFSLKTFDDSAYFLKHQLIWGLLPGIIIGLILYKIDLSLIKKWAPFVLLINLIFMVMVFLPWTGFRMEGSSRWVNLGFTSFQPSEFLKLTFIAYLAVWLSGQSSRQKFFAFLAVIGLISLLLVLQPDASTLGVIVLTSIIMYFSINTPLLHTAFLLMGGALGLFLLIKFSSYRFERFLAFLHSGFEPMGSGYQIKHALIAIGSGGITGVGLGMSAQKHGFLPQIISDSIFAVFAEETGFIGALFLIVLFLIFAWRGFKIAKESKDNFCRLAALGITAWIIIQSFVNIGAMIGVLPLTGIPLPFISYGGSSLVTTMAGIGILLNISKQTT